MIILQGDIQNVNEALDKLRQLPVDHRRTAAGADLIRQSGETTLKEDFTISGPSTYHKGRTSRLTFKPTDRHGWWFQRTDIPDAPPIPVHIRKLATAKRNLELMEGAGNNVRMTEHIIAQKHGLRLDNVVIEIPSEDPPLFDEGSQPIADAILAAGTVESANTPLKYYTVKEPVAMMNERGGLLLFEPPEADDHSARLTFDVGIDFPTAIGKQRIVFDLTDDTFRYASAARTNCSLRDLILFKTIGKLSAATRNFGYTTKNILIASKRKYWNQPGLLHHGKSLEAVWHRSCEDLIAALAMLPVPRLVGKISSYKAGHQLDADMMAALTEKNLLIET